jgi:hypothetical protein
LDSDFNFIMSLLRLLVFFFYKLFILRDSIGLIGPC